MPAPDEILDLVKRDVELGLGPFFEPLDDDAGSGFHQPPRFVDQSVITNGDLTTIVWAYRCQHVDWFQGIPPSRDVLTIRGVTVVDHRDGKEPEYHRYIDWLAVLSDLGYGVYHRKLVDVADYDAINEPRLPRT